MDKIIERRYHTARVISPGYGASTVREKDDCQSYSDAVEWVRERAGSGDLIIITEVLEKREDHIIDANGEVRSKPDFVRLNMDTVHWLRKKAKRHRDKSAPAWNKEALSHASACDACHRAADILSGEEKMRDEDERETLVEEFANLGYDRAIRALRAFPA